MQFKNEFVVLFIIIVDTLSFPVDLDLYISDINRSSFPVLSIGSFETFDLSHNARFQQSSYDNSCPKQLPTHAVHVCRVSIN